MLNQKIIKNILILITFYFIYVKYSFCSVECEENELSVIQQKSHYNFPPLFPNDILAHIFEIGKGDKDVRRKLRSVCTLFRDKEAAYANKGRIFYFRLNQESLPVFKRLPHPTVIIQAVTLQHIPFFF